MQAYLCTLNGTVFREIDPDALLTLGRRPITFYVFEELRWRLASIKEAGSVVDHECHSPCQQLMVRLKLLRRHFSRAHQVRTKKKTKVGGVHLVAVPILCHCKMQNFYHFNPFKNQANI